MKIGLALIVIWIAGMDLGLCLGNQAAGGASIPQAWVGAAILNAIALTALGWVLFQLHKD